MYGVTNELAGNTNNRWSEYKVKTATNDQGYPIFERILEIPITDQVKNEHMPIKTSDNEAESFHISKTKANIKGYEEEEEYAEEYEYDKEEEKYEY